MDFQSGILRDILTVLIGLVNITSDLVKLGFASLFSKRLS